MKRDLVTCDFCSSAIDLAFADDAPAMHEGAAGTADDPRSPGDYNNVCDVCCYLEGRRGSPGAARPYLKKPAARRKRSVAKAKKAPWNPMAEYVGSPTHIVREYHRKAGR